MIHRRDLDPRKKYPLGEYLDGMNYTEEKFQGVSERHSMGGNGEIQSMVSSVMQGFREMTCNTILSG